MKISNNLWRLIFFSIIFLFIGRIVWYIGEEDMCTISYMYATFSALPYIYLRITFSLACWWWPVPFNYINNYGCSPSWSLVVCTYILYNTYIVMWNTLKKCISRVSKWWQHKSELIDNYRELSTCLHYYYLNRGGGIFLFVHMYIRR